MIRTLGILQLVLLLGCKPISNKTMKDHTQTKEISYLALGDSYTIGTAIQSHEAFPFQLADSIEANRGFKVNVKIVAQNGWRTDDLIRGIKRTTLDEKYDLVSLLIGVNNQYQQLPLAVYKNEFIRLLDTAVTLAQTKEKVFVLSIPNYGVTPFGEEKKEETTAQLKMFNQIADSVCEARGISYFDVTTISLEAETRQDFRAKDNLHPSAVQYAAWVGSFLNKVLEKLQ